MEVSGICSLCGKPGKMHTCKLCGSIVCNNCYNPRMNICKSCETRNTEDIKSFK